MRGSSWKADSALTADETYDLHGSQIKWIILKLIITGERLFFTTTKGCGASS